MKRYILLFQHRFLDAQFSMGIDPRYINEWEKRFKNHVLDFWNWDWVITSIR